MSEYSVEKLKRLIEIARNQKLKIQELEKKHKEIKDDMMQCVNAITSVFSAIMGKNGKVNMNKALTLMTNPNKIKTPIENLMNVVEKYGQKSKS